ncbi:MAG: hypothetical protein ACE5NP_09175 [Anaerolineae bacterium]
MHVQVDQSGKIEQTSLDTVLAFTDGTNKEIASAQPSLANA